MSVSRSFARGWMTGFFLLGPMTFTAFIIEDAFALLPAPRNCPASISLHESDAELHAASKRIHESCALVFTSSEGSAAGGGMPLKDLTSQPGLTFVSDTEGFSAFRAIVFNGRLKRPARKTILIINPHYAHLRTYGEDLAATYFSDSASFSRYDGPMPFAAGAPEKPPWPVLNIYRSMLSRRIGVPLLRALAPRPPAPPPADLNTDPEWGLSPEIARRINVDEMRRARSIPDLSGSLFENALRELQGEVLLLCLPLHSRVYAKIGLSAAEHEARIEQSLRRSGHRFEILRDLDRPEYWYDSIHFNERGRRALARRIEKETQ